MPGGEGRLRLGKNALDRPGAWPDSGLQTSSSSGAPRGASPGLPSGGDSLEGEGGTGTFPWARATLSPRWRSGGCSGRGLSQGAAQGLRCPHYAWKELALHSDSELVLLKHVTSSLLRCRDGLSHIIFLVISGSGPLHAQGSSWEGPDWIVS